jgi:hypothetical protein
MEFDNMNNKLGKLKEIDLREAWNHEATSFTPWLAENLEMLGEVIGFPIELVGQEVAVETFSADILAQNPIDNKLILIENQLEDSDHKHLGQIMTYLAGLETQIVIWIAREFRDSHLSAIQWLNDHTDGQCSFFAVKLKVVQIGESQLAPVFEVLAKPNNWERQLHEITKGTGHLSDLGKFRKEFWGHYLSKYSDEKKYGIVSATSNRWRIIEGLNLVISIYLAKNSVGIFLRGERGVDGETVSNILLPYKDVLEDKLSTEFGSIDGDYFLGSFLKANTKDREQWEKLIEWLYIKSNLYDKVLRSILET